MFKKLWNILPVNFCLSLIGMGTVVVQYMQDFEKGLATNNNSAVLAMISKWACQLQAIALTLFTIPSYQHTISPTTFCIFPFFYSNKDTWINYLQNTLWRCCMIQTILLTDKNQYHMDGYLISNQISDINFMWEKKIIKVHSA